MKFSAQLRTLRESLGLTQAEAAAILGCGKRTVEHWESGDREPLEVTQEGVMARLKVKKKNRNNLRKTLDGAEDLCSAVITLNQEQPTRRNRDKTKGNTK